MALDDRIAVVTGAALGIGRAITELLLQNCAKVVLLDVNENAGRSLKEALDKQYGQGRTLFLNCNVESEEQIKAAFQTTVKTYGGIDILCNNAGILNENSWEKTVSINLKIDTLMQVGVIRATYLALEHMSKLTGGRGGVIVNVASTAGLGPMLTCPAYTASKYGVIGFTRAMAAASTVSGYGIRFNALCPGFVRTDLFSTIVDSLGQFSHLADVIHKYADNGVLTVCEVAECLLELVIDETKNGEALVVTPTMKDYVMFHKISQ